jgi:hypothetical protein
VWPKSSNDNLEERCKQEKRGRNMGPAWFPLFMGLPPFRPMILRTVHLTRAVQLSKFEPPENIDLLFESWKNNIAIKVSPECCYEDKSHFRVLSAAFSWTSSQVVIMIAFHLSKRYVMRNNSDMLTRTIKSVQFPVENDAPSALLF